MPYNSNELKMQIVVDECDQDCARPDNAGNEKSHLVYNFALTPDSYKNAKFTKTNLKPRS